MKNEAEATFEIKSWDEKPYQEVDEVKFTRASVTKVYRGDIEGEATSESLMFYQRDGSAAFTGLERIVGTIGLRGAGRFVATHAHYPNVTFSMEYGFEAPTSS